MIGTLDEPTPAVGPLQTALRRSPFTPAMAARQGLGRASLERLARAGGIVRLIRGVYLAADAPVTRETRREAIELVVGPRQVLAGRAAAWFHGCDAAALTLGLPGERGGVPLEFADQPDLRRRAEVHGRLRVVDPAAAAVDLARRAAAVAALAGLDGLLAAGALTHPELLTAVSGWPGPLPAGLIALAARADGRARGPAETALRWSWLQARLPTPALGVVVGGARIALAVPSHRFGAVLAGDLEPAARAALAERGWLVAALPADRVLATDPVLLGQHLEREFHQHLLDQMDWPSTGFRVPR